jgi:hypothetical protein
MVKRRFVAGVTLILALCGSTQAQTPTTAIIGTPPQPGWSLLSTQQKIILAPLASEWDAMDNLRRKKWLGIAERFPKMNPDERERVQHRMHEWAALSPEQRARVRDSYKEFNQLAPEKKRALKKKWETFSNLTEEEKRVVRETGKLPAPRTTESDPSLTSAPSTTNASEVASPSCNTTTQKQ